MFTAYATEDTSTLSFNECLLATGHNITEYMQINLSVGVDVVPEVVLRVRLDSDRKLGIEDSHVRARREVITEAFKLIFCVDRSFCITGSWNFLV